MPWPPLGVAVALCILVVRLSVRLSNRPCNFHDNLYTVPKRIPDIFDCNLNTNYQILIIFDTNIPDTTWQQMAVQFPTSPNVCFCTTWGNYNQRNITFYARKQLLLSARLSHRSSVCLSVRLSVTQVDQSKTVQARITKFSLSAARKTLVSGTVKLFHKFEGGHPERGR